MRCATCQNDLYDDAAYCPRCGERQHDVPECDVFDYAAFISYRHRQPDAEVAEKLHRAVETYRLPNAIARRYGSQKLGRVFRDRDELPATGSLPVAIRDALRHARTLIVVCSTETPESRWVAQEIELFASYHGRDRIYAVLADGSSSQSMPAALRSYTRVRPDGEQESVAAEPLAADMRSGASSRFDEEKLRIIAAIAGCGYDELRQRDRIRKRKLAAIFACAALAIAAIIGFFAWQANEQHVAAQIEESQHLSVQSEKLLAQGDRYGAVEKALEALPASSASGDRPFLPEAQLALEQAVQVYPSPTTWRSLYILDAESIVDYVVSMDDSWVAVIDRDMVIRTYDTQTGRLLRESPPLDGVLKVRVGDCKLLACDKMLVCCSLGDVGDGFLLGYSPDGKKAAWGGRSQWLAGICCSSDGKLVAKLGQDDTGDEYEISVVRSADGKEQGSIRFESSLFPIDDAQSDCKMAVSPDGSCVFAVSSGLLLKADLKNSQVTTQRLDHAYPITQSLDYSDGLIVACSCSELSLNKVDAAIDVVDESLHEAWSKSFLAPTRVVENGIQVNSAPRFWFAHEISVGSGQDRGSVDAFLVSAGTDAMALSAQDGSTLETFSRKSPIIEVFPDSLMNLIIMSADGHVSQTSGKLGGYTRVVDSLSTDVEGYYSHATTTQSGALLFALDEKTKALKVLEEYSQLWLPKAQNVATRSSKGRIGDTGLDASSVTSVLLHVENCDHTKAIFAAMGRLWLVDLESIGVFNSFELTAILKLESGEKLTAAYFSRTDPDILYCCSENSEDTFKVWAVDVSAEEVVGSFAQPAIPGSNNQRSLVSIEGESSSALCVHYMSAETLAVQIRLLDPRTLEEKNVLTIPEFVSVRSFESDGLVVSFGRGIETDKDRNISAMADEWSVVVVDSSTGQKVDCDASRCRYGKQVMRFTPSPSNKGFLVDCSDGYLRYFTLPEGRLSWETPFVAGEQICVTFSPDGLRIVARDAESRWLELDATNGEVIASTTGVSDPIVNSRWSSDGKRLYLSTGANRFASPSMYSLNLSADSFGFESRIPSALTLSEDETQILVAGELYPFVIPRYTLDDLIERGKDVLAARESQ